MKAITLRADYLETLVRQRSTILLDSSCICYHLKWVYFDRAICLAFRKCSTLHKEQAAEPMVRSTKRFLGFILNGFGFCSGDRRWEDDRGEAHFAICKASNFQPTSDLNFYTL